MVVIEIKPGSGYEPKNDTCEHGFHHKETGLYQDGWHEIDATESEEDITKSKPYTFKVTTPAGRKYKYKVKVISQDITNEAE